MADSDEETYSSINTILGTTRRDARWHLTDEVEVITVFGRARFDLREVETTGSEIVEISMKCIFGTIDFIVPGGTVVVLDGASFLAGARSDVAPDGDSTLPRLEISSLTILGRVRIMSPPPQQEVDEEVAEEAPAISEAPPEDESQVEPTAGSEPDPAPESQAEVEAETSDSGDPAADRPSSAEEADEAEALAS